MITVNIRKQGGAAVITIPSDILKMLDIEIGATLEINVENQKIVAHPLRKLTRTRYSLQELLKGATAKEMAIINKKTAWARTGKAKGREIE